ncbi:FCD domain-containing protein [Chromobacterium sphagni]|uniref:Pyruvate dehydrogenase complex repressor n=1 Tax=Chromobacterium sphagni TaxID=1903179 RepID=A0A1S1WWB8_9NEIS|nr:FCD domain-containing protein [Chromobacterium sphagni]OHX11417.1 GntR family transcriptional regulator [Chromobacterium sphagni]OHX20961.1 GntR family transcriptional regulator [Chromobacterium sphagni]
MNYPKVTLPKLSDVIVRQLEKRILDGVLKPGDRLPPERQLAEEFGVSRPSLREAIQQLASRGLLSSRQGGGTWVTDRLETAWSDPWEKLLHQHEELRGDLLEFRRVLEGTVARCAASRATPADLERLQRCVDKLQQAYSGGDLTEQARADVEFHQAVAEASHNVLFAHLSGSLLSMLHRHVKDNIANLFAVGEVAEALRDQHLAIWRAIRERKPSEAQLAAERHLDFVAGTLQSQQQQTERDERARMRLAQGSPER